MRLSIEWIYKLRRKVPISFIYVWFDNIIVKLVWTFLFFLHIIHSVGWIVFLIINKVSDEVSIALDLSFSREIYFR